MKKEKRTPRKGAVEGTYKPSQREQSMVSEFRQRSREANPSPKVRVDRKKNGAPTLTFDHPDIAVAGALLTKAFGTTEVGFLNGMLQQITSAGSPGERLDANGINFMLSVINDIEPQDQMEAMLGAQMAAVHMATMAFAKRLAQVETIEQQDSALRAFNKLTRTFTTQIEALKRYRTGGEQKVTVEHVTVNQGGQAIVGNVGGGTKNKGSTR